MARKKAESPNYKQIAIKTCIVLFCAWHMFAVGTYSLAADIEEDTMRKIHAVVKGACPTKSEKKKIREQSLLSRSVYAAKLCNKNSDGEFEPYLWLQKKVRRKVRPYLLITSQWQRWNLFSPDPLRRVPMFVLDVKEGKEWRTFQIVSPDTVHGFMRGYKLKTLRRLEGEDKFNPIRKRYLEIMCTRANIRPGREVRLRIRSFVIPKYEKLASPAWWFAFEPKWRDKVATETICPPKQS